MAEVFKDRKVKFHANCLLKMTRLSLLLLLTAYATSQPVQDPLPAWTEGASKQWIIDFVHDVKNGWLLVDVENDWKVVFP